MTTFWERYIFSKMENNVLKMENYLSIMIKSFVCESTTLFAQIYLRTNFFLVDIFPYKYREVRSFNS